jgi:hypothetical protein
MNESSGALYKELIHTHIMIFQTTNNNTNPMELAILDPVDL